MQSTTLGQGALQAQRLRTPFFGATTACGLLHPELATGYLIIVARTSQVRPPEPWRWAIKALFDGERRHLPERQLQFNGTQF
jgi:hypothetical protein